MAIAPYLERTKIAASQAIAGFDPDAFTQTLDQTAVGISLGPEVATTFQGRACADLLVRLCARLYPHLVIAAGGTDASQDGSTLGGQALDGASGHRLRQTLGAIAEDLTVLAKTINPELGTERWPITVVHIGSGRPILGQTAATTFFVGCDDWTGRFSTAQPLEVGTGEVPIGAGVAACLAASALFRHLLDSTAPPAGAAELCALPTEPNTRGPFTLPARSALVGAGALGQAFLWAITHSPIAGSLHVVEPETVDLGNLQRYVLTDMESVGHTKTSSAVAFVAETQGPNSDLKLISHDMAWAEANSHHGPSWDLVAVAVDSAEARRAVQASLPRRLVNAWTQTGDLGVSTHDFLNGACCSCLYLPHGPTRNEDELVAEALGIPDRVMDVRARLYDGQPVDDNMLSAVAIALSLDPASVETFRGAGIRDLYVRGICGGVLIPLAHHAGGNPVHVPLAHQSAMAGILQAARVLQASAGESPDATEIIRIDIRRDPPTHPHQRAAKDPRGACICQDADYVTAYEGAWQELG